MKKTLTIQNDINELNKLPLFVEELCKELNLPPEMIFHLNLVLEEAVTNIIFYAFPKQTESEITRQEEQEITILAELLNHSLHLTITDCGIPFDPTKVAEADITLSTEERPIGGLGIFLIKQLMDEVKYQRIDGRNVFTMKKEL